MSVLICDNLIKINKKSNSIKNFSYNFLENNIYALVGKSDSGKEILLDIMTAKTKPTEGIVYVDGEPLFNNEKMLARLCYISKNTEFPAHMKISTIFNIMNAVYPKWDNSFAYELIEYFKINPKAKFGSLLTSKKKLLLGIMSLASRANITLYDDPVSESDIKDRYDFYNFLYNHHLRYPRTIIIATDYVDEIDYIFDKVLLIDQGKLIDHFTSEDVQNNFKYLTGKTEVLKSLIKDMKLIGVEERGKTLTVCIRKKLTKDEIRKFQKYLIKISEVPIQKVFIYLINIRELRGKKLWKRFLAH